MGVNALAIQGATELPLFGINGPRITLAPEKTGETPSVILKEIIDGRRKADPKTDPYAVTQALRETWRQQSVLKGESD